MGKHKIEEIEIVKSDSPSGYYNKQIVDWLKNIFGILVLGIIIYAIANWADIVSFFEKFVK